MAIVVNNKKYYPISEIAELSGVKIRTLRRWINKGELDHFLFGYKGEKTPVLFRLEPPDESDTIYEEGRITIYHLPEEFKERGGLVDVK